MTDRAHIQLDESFEPPLDHEIREEVTSPGASFIVQAPAGSGKTTLLVTRYLRLLSVVNQPEEILAITFTRKAAREMKTRVLSALTDAQDTVAADALERSRAMHWDIELNPQRLKIQTIDSFAYGLVQRLPYESQLSLDYQRVDNSNDIYEDAAIELLDLIFTDDDFADDVAEAMALLQNDHGKTVRTLRNMLGERQHWIAPVRSVFEHIANERLDAFIASLEGTRVDYVNSIIQSIKSLVHSELLEQCRELCAFAASNLDLEFADFSEQEDWRILARTFFTDKFELRRRITKREGFPSESTDEKQRWIEVAEDLGQLEFREKIGKLRDLPSETVPDQHRFALEKFAIILIVLVRQLNTIFQQREIVDFTELAFAAQRALERDEMPTELALALDYKISHILIDEYQDTSQAQFDLLERVMDTWNEDSGNTFFAVGDPMQSIYRFRNANLTLFQRTFRDGLRTVQVQPRRLTSNFRSTETLVSWTNRAFEKIFGNEEDPTFGSVSFARSIPIRPSEGFVSIVLCTNDPQGTEQAEQTASRISQLRSQFPDEKIGMLVHARTNLPIYFRALRDEGLTWRGVDIVPLAHAPVVRDLYTLVQCYNEDRDRLSWLSLFRSPLCGLSLPDLEVLAQEETGSAMLNCTYLSSQGLQSINRVREEFEHSERERHLTLRSQIERLWFRLGGNDAYPDTDSLINAERFLALLEASSRGEIRLDELWNRIAAEYSSESLESADVEIMTIHKAKGLEFEHVVLPDLNASGRPSQRGLIEWRVLDDQLLIALNLADQQDPFFDWLHQEESIKDVNEKKRLLYVAMTRARKTLSMIGCFRDENLKPRSNSLLSFLTPFFTEASLVEGTPTPVTEPKSGSTVLTRLREDYRFDLQDLSITPSWEQNKVLPFERTTQPPVGFQTEIGLGNLVHRELRRLAQESDRSISDSERTASWRNFLRCEGIEGANLAFVLEQTERQLQNVVSDSDGKWVLSSHHSDAGSEVPYSAFIDGNLKNIVVDRTFVDEHDTRWIIDYKTAMIPPSSEENLETYVRTHYLDQMKLYKEVVSKFDERPIRSAVYLTNIPRVIEI